MCRCVELGERLEAETKTKACECRVPAISSSEPQEWCNTRDVAFTLGCMHLSWENCGSMVARVDNWISFVREETKHKNGSWEKRHIIHQ